LIVRVLAMIVAGVQECLFALSFLLVNSFACLVS
jgi:hypothetical protein